MTTAATTPAAKKQRRWVSDLFINGTLILLVLIWTIPTFALLVSSFRDRFEIQTSGWWTIFPHRTWETVRTIPVPD